MENRTVRFNTSLAGNFATRPGVVETLDFEPGQDYAVPVELAAKWISSGIAEPVNPSRSAEVERATREPRAEQAVRLNRRRRGR